VNIDIVHVLLVSSLIVTARDLELVLQIALAMW